MQRQGQEQGLDMQWQDKDYISKDQDNDKEKVKDWTCEDKVSTRTMKVYKDQDKDKDLACKDKDRDRVGRWLKSES